MSNEPIMLTPGTLRISPRVLAASAATQYHHRSPQMQDAFQKIRNNLYRITGLSRLDYDFVLFPTTGRGALEALLSSTMIANYTSILCNGRWSNYMAEVVRNYEVLAAYEIAVHYFSENRPLQEAQLKALFEEVSVVNDVVCFVAHETERGLLNPTVELVNIIRRAGCDVIVDITSALVVEDLPFDKMSTAAYVFNASKGLRSVRDVGIVAVRKDFAALLPSVGVYLNFKNEWLRQIENELPRVPFSAGVVFALLEATDELLEEGLQNRRNNIISNMKLVHEWAYGASLKFLTNPEYLGWATLPLELPSPWTYRQFRQRLLDRGYDVFYSAAGPEGNSFEVSTLGWLTADEVRGFLKTCTEILWGWL